MMKQKILELLHKPIFWIGCGALLVVVLLIWICPYFFMKSEKTEWVLIYPKATEEKLDSAIYATFDHSFASRTLTFLHLFKVNPANRTGAYKIEKGKSPFQVAHQLKSAGQTPIKFTFNNVRTIDELGNKVAKNFMMSKKNFFNALFNDSTLSAWGYNKETVRSIFLPDSYEFYWTVKPEKMISTIKSYHDNWWTPARIKKAQKMNLSPEDATTIASITEEETAKMDERGKVARLYINRLVKGMPLQADPTVKFALNDFTIRRITKEHLKVVSPYNTYSVKGLPPGPIRFPEKSSIDAVLNAPMHSYIYMCAKEDFSGYHNFTDNFAQHLAFARNYQAALNKKGIN